MKVDMATRLSPPAGKLPAGAVSAADLDEALTMLKSLDTSNLRMRWRELFGRNAPARLGADLLHRAIAHRLQELTLGGLSRQAQLRLKALSQQSGKGGTGQRTSSTAAIVKPGTRFVREWQGSVHEVQAIDTGVFVYRGKTYRSLSVIAREITGTHQSGPRFFGVRKNDPRAAAREGTNG
jgi:hypothetical protein